MARVCALSSHLNIGQKIELPLIRYRHYARASIMAPATPLLFLDDAKAPNWRKNNGFKDLGNYSEWPKVAGAVINALCQLG
jgi:hypothetical protein